ncbi:MAG: hypothetical protein QOE26_2771 [Verrucomicrobiota bacterium]|jgi:hypothetical protein
MSKIILGRLASYLVVLLIGFFTARHMLSANVAQKLMKGDTVELWGGAWTVNMKQIVDFLQVAIIPTLIPLGLAIWGRVKARYELILARLSPKVMTHEEVKEQTAATPVSQIIATVASKPA